MYRLHYKHIRDENNHVVFKNGEEDSELSETADFQGALVSDEIWFTADKIERIKAIPIWFVSSIDDSVLAPWLYVLPDYCALFQAGAEHCFLSMFSTYNHSIWKAVLQNRVTGVQDSTAFAGLQIPTVDHANDAYYPLEPTDEGGGTFEADGYCNLYAWINSFSRKPVNK